MGKAEDERLQRYFDGELPAEELARVEAALTEDDRLKLAALGEVRGLVANALIAEAADVDLWPASSATSAAAAGKAAGAPSLGAARASGELVGGPFGGGGGGVALRRAAVASCAGAERVRHREPRDRRRG